VPGAAISDMGKALDSKREIVFEVGSLRVVRLSDRRRQYLHDGLDPLRQRKEEMPPE
jgi:hypothetical protein